MIFNWIKWDNVNVNTEHYMFANKYNFSAYTVETLHKSIVVRYILRLNDLNIYKSFVFRSTNLSKEWNTSQKPGNFSFAHKEVPTLEGMEEELIGCECTSVNLYSHGVCFIYFVTKCESTLETLSLVILFDFQRLEHYNNSLIKL